MAENQYIVNFVKRLSRFSDDTGQINNKRIGIEVSKFHLEYGNKIPSFSPTTAVAIIKSANINVKVREPQVIKGLTLLAKKVGNNNNPKPTSIQNEVETMSYESIKNGLEKIGNNDTYFDTASVYGKLTF